MSLRASLTAPRADPVGDLRVLRLRLRRRLGESGRVELDLPRSEGVSSHMYELYASGPLAADVTWAGPESGLVLPAFRVSGVQWVDDDHELVRLLGEVNVDDPEGPSAARNRCLQRRRILRAADLAQLWDRLEHVVALPQYVRNHLQRIALPRGNDGCFVQDAISDCDVARILVRQARWLGLQEPFAELALTGELGPRQVPSHLLRVAWGSKSAYEEEGMVPNRRATPEEGVQTSIGMRGPAVRDEHQTLLRLWSDRSFGTQAWADWIDRTLPLFEGDADHFVVGVTDRLQLFEQDQGVEWVSELELEPAGEVAAASPGVVWPRFEGEGLVVGSDPSSAWLDVELESFEEQANRIRACIETPYAGEDGTSGVHFVPEPGTRVGITWSGDVREPAVVTGNRRTDAPRHAAPSMDLSRPLGLDLGDVEAHEVGQIECHSALLARTESLLVEAGGAKAEMRGGSFRTSR